MGGDVNIWSGLAGLDGSGTNGQYIGATTEKSGDINLMVNTKTGYDHWTKVVYGSINLGINNQTGLTVYTADIDTDTPTVFVGIGTTTPSSPLHVYSSENVLAKFRSTDSIAGISLQDTSDTAYLLTSTATLSLGFASSLSSANLNVDVDGHVGIGTTNPATTLDVNGEITADGYLGYQTFVYHSMYDTTSAADAYWIPFGYIVESTTQRSYHRLLMPYAGVVKFMTARFETANAPNYTDFKMYKAVDGTLEPATLVQTENIAIAQSNYDFTIPMSGSFGKGDVLAFTVDPTEAPNDVLISVVVEFDITD